jgi:hypothetical protein
MELLYLIQLSNGNYSYVYTDKEGNILPNDNEEIHYYVNDLEDFYYEESFFAREDNFVDDFNSSKVTLFNSSEWSSS